MSSRWDLKSDSSKRRPLPDHLTISSVTTSDEYQSFIASSTPLAYCDGVFRCLAAAGRDPAHRLANSQLIASKGVKLETGVGWIGMGEWLIVVGDEEGRLDRYSEYTYSRLTVKGSWE